MPGLDLLDVAQRLGVQRAARGDEDAGRLAVHQRDRAVLHLGRRVALGVDVADLLELQRPFERDREVEVAAQVEGASRRRDPGRGLVDQRLGLEDLAEQVGDRLDRLEHGQPVREREVPQPAEMQAPACVSTATWAENALVLATPTSGPAWR